MSTQIHIVLVDDDEVDAEMVVRALRKSGLRNDMVLFRDGVEALTAFQTHLAQKLRNEPYLILLDLSMPRMNGFEFLDALRSNTEFRGSIVFIFTGSERPEDRTAAYDRQVAGYLIKSRLGENYHLLPILLQAYCQAVVFK